MAEFMVQSATWGLGKLLVEEENYLNSVSDKVEDLQDELRWMQCFLQDADSKHHNDAVVREWIHRIKDFAYEAEDIIERYIIKMSSEKQDRLLTSLKWLCCIMKETKAIHEVGSEIEALTLKISKITSRMQIYGVQPRNIEINSSFTKTQIDSRTSYTHLDDDVVIGSDKSIMNLVNVLIKNKHCKVVAIGGLSGLGKTTFARKIYHYPSIREHFNSFAWIHVSQQFQPSNMLKEILLPLGPKKDMDWRKQILVLDNEDLPAKLYQVLTEKNYLVVLDDIKTTEAWNLVRTSLPMKDYGSKVILTTQNSQILSDMDPGVFSHDLDFLDPDQGWELLQKRAGLETKDRADPKMIELGKKMAEYCKGLPLAIMAAGGVLASKETSTEWQVVHDNMSSYLRRGKVHGQSFSGVHDLLAVSYSDLPYYLKPCFLTLGNFPEGYDISAKRLYSIWIAEDIVTEILVEDLEEESLEDLAEHYLNELVHRGMVQVVQRGCNGRIKSCRLHDLMRELCLQKAREENFLNIIDHCVHPDEPLSGSLLEVDRRLRRLAIFLGAHVHSSLPTLTSQRASHLRSLLFFTEEHHIKVSWGWKKSVCIGFRFLRILDFEDFGELGSLPREVGNLFHLRYLSLKGSNVSELPSTISRLRCLQTLDIRANPYCTIPNVLWKMKRLRCVYFPENCDTTGSSLLLRLDNLRFLRTLKNVPNFRAEDVLKLTNLKKLHVSYNQWISMKELQLIIGSPHIESTGFCIPSHIIDEEPNKLSSCYSLHKLQISGKISVQLRYMKLPESLKELRLRHCELQQDPMPILEKLPNLRSLDLNYNCFLGKQMTCSATGFPQLTYLRLGEMENLEDWTVEAGAMADLLSLGILHCSKLKSVPQELPRLVHVYCRPCISGAESYGTCAFKLRKQIQSIG